jgi:amidase
VAFYADDGQATPTPEIAATVQRAALALAEAGLSVEEARPACLSQSREISQRYWAMSELSGQQVEQLLLDWDRFRGAMLGFMGAYDLIVCPADYRPASRHDEEAEQRFNYTLPFSVTGWPCVVVRAGTSPDRLPLGVQIVARAWREDVALAAAQQVEAALGGWQPPPI